MGRFAVAFAFIASIASSAVHAVAVPNPLDIFSPPILTPNAQTVWHVNDKQNVTWDPSNPPVVISNGARIILTSTLNQIPQLTLAQGFSLLDGFHEIQIPDDLETREDYMIMLFGDSGNVSPAFTIIGHDSE